MKASTLPSPDCPQCGSSLVRMRREFGDRVLSLVVPVLRCRCAAGICGWQGVVRRSTANAALLMGSGFYASRHVLEPSRGHRTADTPHTVA